MEEKLRNFFFVFLNKDVILFVLIRKEMYNKEELVEWNGVDNMV